MDNPTTEIFPSCRYWRSVDSDRVEELSIDLSLDPRRCFARMARLLSSFVMLTVTSQRFEETINGREFLIEVSAVGSNRWRAHLVRLPGGSTALMPFYGATPQEAAQQLSRWLARVHGSTITPSPGTQVAVQRHV